jgi:predicted protein tyrosine phosphatase
VIEIRKVLFVCSKNQWRSPTAEAIWRRHPSLLVRSGGTNSSAKHPVGIEDIYWADVIFVMEDKHKSALQRNFSEALSGKLLYVLDIPDEYKFMDSELVEELRSSVGSILELT